VNQFNWTYLADNGKKHVVGIYHGAESGHLLVYCDSKIIMIDFEVLESSSYSFFIGDQLCELEIELRDKKFYYGFNINKTADTPLNRIRKKVEKKHLMQSLAFVGGLIFLVLGLLWGVQKLQSGPGEDMVNADRLLQQFGEETDARVLLTSEKGHLVSYYFMVDEKVYTVRTKKIVGKDFAPENGGMPIEKGDEFVVRYLPENPDLCEFDYSRPTPNQIRTYQERALEKHLTLNNSLTKGQSACMVELAFELKGIKGLADFYYQDSSPDENLLHNRNSYLKLVRDVPFQQERKKRCGISG